MATMLERLRAWLTANYALVLALLIPLAYAPVFRAGFVWDDDENILESKNLHDLAGLLRIWRDPHASQQYYPLTHTSFWLQVQTTGLSPLAFHVVNLALHAATAVLLLTVLRRLALAGAELAATLFALHPLNVESVAWVTERKNVLSGALALAACLFFLLYDDAAFGSSTGEQARRRRYWWLALACFVLALAAKTAVAVLPAALLVILIGLRQRPGWRVARALAPFFAVGAAAGLGTAFLERTHVHAQGSEFDWSFAERLLIAGRAFCFYPFKLLLPEGLVFFYPKWTIETHALTAWLFPIGVVALLAALVVLRRRWGLSPLVAVLAYAVLIFPALGFFNVYFMRFSYVQNHFQYLAGIPVLALFAGLLARVLARVGSALRLGVAGAIALACGALTFAESASFHDYETLFLTTLERNPNAWVAAYNLGIYYQDRGNAQRAIEMYQSAARSHPGDPEISMNLGTALAAAGRAREALVPLAQAVQLRPEHPESRLNFAAALDLAGQPAAAVVAYREALRLRPGYTRAARQQAWLLATTGDAAVRDGPAAVALATSACARTTRAVARCQDTLAAAEAAAGNFESAAARARHAAELARAEGQAQAADHYQARARLYATHQPYIETNHARERDESPATNQ